MDKLPIGSTGADPVIAALTQPAAGLTITGGAGSITFALANDLAAVEGLATTGIVSRTAADTWIATTVTQHAVIIGAAGEIPAMLGPLTNGQLVVGSTGVAPVAASLASADGSVTITAGAGTIDLSSAPGIVWTNISANQALVINNGVNCTGGAALSLSLPATSAVGTVIEVALDGSTSWTITQGAGQQIRLGNQTTTAGAGGSLASTAQGDWVRLVCKTADTIWTCVGVIGNITIL